VVSFSGSFILLWFATDLFTGVIAVFSVRAGALQPESWLAKALPILAGVDKRLHHLSVGEVAMKLIELVQPEVVAGEVECWFRWIVWISAQLTEVLHQHERFVKLLLGEG
jgi:hypothetical protein